MKIRTGFVSNSSTTSYTCGVCGDVASGFDLDLTDFNMFVCENGHTICEEHQINGGEILDAMRLYEAYRLWHKEKDYVELEKDVGRLIKDGKHIELQETTQGIGIDWEDRYETPEIFCPCCNFEEIDDQDVITYIYKKYHIDRPEILAEMKEKFKIFEDLQNFAG